VRRRSPLAAVGLALVAATAFAQSPLPHSVVPKDGFVPNASTAIRIAEAVWIPIYGQENVEREKPFKAELRGNNWIVTGSLPSDMDGGVAIAEISRADGCVRRVSHGK
jgi:NTF2 fold immunity protein